MSATQKPKAGPKPWRYRNDSGTFVIWNGRSWEPGEEYAVSYPIPQYMNLTCLQEGEVPDPVLCHEDVILKVGESTRIDIAAPLPGQKVLLTLTAIGDSGAECRFNNENNKAIPVDGRSFSCVLPWECCASLHLTNIAESESQISVTAVAQ